MTAGQLWGKITKNQLHLKSNLSQSDVMPWCCEYSVQNVLKPTLKYTWVHFDNDTLVDRDNEGMKTTEQKGLLDGYNFMFWLNEEIDETIAVGLMAGYLVINFYTSSIRGKTCFVCNRTQTQCLRKLNYVTRTREVQVISCCTVVWPTTMLKENNPHQNNMKTWPYPWHRKLIVPPGK